MYAKFIKFLHSLTDCRNLCAWKLRGREHLQTSSVHLGSRVTPVNSYLPDTLQTEAGRWSVTALTSLPDLWDRLSTELCLFCQFPDPYKLSFVKTIFRQKQHTCLYKLDGVLLCQGSPIDNKLSADYLQHPVRKNQKNQEKVTCDIWHMKQHMTCDQWHMRGVGK